MNGPPSSVARGGAWRVALPAAGAVALAVVLAATLGPDAALLGGFLVAYLVPPLSKETVLPLAVAAGFSPLVVALAFTATDLLLAAFVAWNWEALHRLPRLGPRLAKVQARVERGIRSWPRGQHLRLPAVFLFMAVPLVGSGAATASLLGRALGEHAFRVFGAVAAGSVVLNFAYAFLADAVVREAGPLGLAGAVAVLVGVAVAVAAFRAGRRGEGPPPAAP